ncbi:MAG: nuclear transport factor 2 family protein [Acidimicrobiales bacterium]
MTDDETLALADRMFRDIETGDLDDLRGCYHPDIVVWANYDGREHDLEGSMRLLGWLCAKLQDRCYDVTRRDVIPGGFLQEHVLRGTAPDGSAVAMPACIVATVADGRITRMNEYLDPVGVSALSA